MKNVKLDKLHLTVCNLADACTQKDLQGSQRLKRKVAENCCGINSKVAEQVQ